MERETAPLEVDAAAGNGGDSVEKRGDSRAARLQQEQQQQEETARGGDGDGELEDIALDNDDDDEEHVDEVDDHEETAPAAANEQSEREDGHVDDRKGDRQGNKEVSQSQSPHVAVPPVPASANEGDEQKRPPSPTASSVSSTATTGTTSRAAVCSDPSLNDALLQLQLLLTAHVARMYGILWPSDSGSRKLVEAGFSPKRVVALRKVSQQDIERGLEQVLQYLAILLRDRTGTVVPMCVVLLRVREQAISMDPQKAKKTRLLPSIQQREPKEAISETSLAMEGILFSTLNELLAGVSAATVVEPLDARGEAVVNKFVDIAYGHFAKHLKSAEAGSLEPSVVSASSVGSETSASSPLASFEAAMGTALEAIFGYAHGYASHGKHLPSALEAIETLVGWQALQSPLPALVSSQHERLCKELLRRVCNTTTRISGLDHMQRYLKSLPPTSSLPGPEPLDEIPKALFVDEAVPRAQEAALVSAVMVELGRCFPRLFDATMARGLTSTKTTTAQRAICLNALSKIAQSVPQGERSPLRGYAKFVINLSGRDSPVGTVAEALACFPMLGEQSQQLLQNCVNCAFGFDLTLVDAGRDALIRFCQLGPIYAEKAIMVTVESPSLKLVCTMQHTKAPLDTAQISSSVTTLERILCAALDKGFESSDLVAEAGASLLLASTYPDEKVQAKARDALERIGTITDKHGESQYLQRALDKLLLGLLGASGSADSCGGARVQALNKRLARKAGYCDFVAWWRNQCTLICAANLPHSNKPPFVRSLVHEYLTASSNRLQNAALISLSHLKDCHEVLEKQMAMQSLQARNEIFNGLFVKLMAALRDSYRGGALERRVHQMVRTWIQSSGDEVARLHMAKWTPHVVEAAARLLRKFVLFGQLNAFPDPDVARDQAIFLIREWHRTRDRAPRLAAVSDAFVTLLDSGHLKTVDAQSFALEMLSGSAGSKRYQQFGLRALLRQNLDAMLKHYYEAVLRSFDPDRWAKEPAGIIPIGSPASARANDPAAKGLANKSTERSPFMVHIASAVLYALDASVTSDHTLAEGLRPQMALLVSLLFVHPLREMRELVAGWVPHGTFLGLPHRDFSPALVSNKLSGLERSVLVSRFLATHWEASSIDEMVQGAAKVSPYLSDEHISCLLQVLEPWLVQCYPRATRQPGRLITRLLRLCARLRSGDNDPAWGIWRSVSLEEGLEETVRTMVNFVVAMEQDNAQQRSAMDAMSSLFSKSSQLGDAPVDTLHALVAAFPEPSWKVPDKDSFIREAEEASAADAEAIPGLTATERARAEEDTRTSRAVLRLVNHAPFLTRNFSGADLARVLYFTFVEEGVDSALSQRTLRAVNEEFAAGMPALLLHFEADGAREDHDDGVAQQVGSAAGMASANGHGNLARSCSKNLGDLDIGEVTSVGSGGDWLSVIAEHSTETVRKLAETALHCVIYCLEPGKRTRAIMLLQNISTTALEDSFVRELAKRIESRCMYLLKLLELGNGNAATAPRLEALEHLFILGEWLASAPSLERRLREDLAILGTCALSIPVVMRPNPFSRIRVSALKLLQSIGPSDDGEAADPVLQDHLVGCLVHQEVAPRAAEIILSQGAAHGLPEPANFVLLAAAICLVQASASGSRVQAETQRGLARYLVNQVEAVADTRPQVSGLLDQLSARLLALSEPSKSMLMASASPSSAVRRSSDASEDRESVVALSSSVSTPSDFVQNFVATLLRGSGTAAVAIDGSGDADKIGNGGIDVSTESFQAVLQFLVQTIEVGSEPWAFGALELLRECIKHREVASLLLEPENRLLETVMDGLVVALESWPRARRADIFNVMATLRLKPASSFDFIHAETTALAAKQRCLVSGLAHCRAQLDANLH
ncbi:Hypothetical Protein FCC1311_016712 [Hondaea fermentalgiana]|uniref:Uncharacterized protein n=1 Tax=Hondaea fermentalgiana TaxID=2315210 RepID=A0A2R5GA79_9STRA|nr:Hypothetical Protein FCC1311_016712 [Hondaea fermentalgiana]|eukprot:GBG25453.1 Hypothetical Protein FCC1311_016712 [Hondaea fermentalgiana]